MTSSLDPQEAKVLLEDAIWVDAAFCIKDIDPGAAGVFRVAPGDLRGLSFAELIAPRDRAVLLHELDRLRSAQGLELRWTSFAALRGLRRDGQVFPLSLWALHAPQDGAGGFVFIVKRNQDLQRVARERQQAIAMVERIVSTDTGADAANALADQCIPELADFCYVELVRNGDHAFARHRDPRKTPAVDELCRLRLLSGSRNPLRRVLEHGRGQVYPSLSRRMLTRLANSAPKRALLDELAPRSMWLLPLRGRSETIGVVALFRERRGAYEHELKGFGADLGRAAGLAIDLVRSLEAKRRAIDGRDRVLGVVAHDLRNPISTIALATKALRLELGEVAPGVEGKLSLIERTSLQMKILVGDLLQISQLDAGMLQLSPGWCDACALIEDVANSTMPLASAAALRLVVDRPENPRWIFADPLRLSQVLSNLLSNAVKFTPSGGVVRLQLVDMGSMVRFVVEDTGPGIAPSDQAQLFAPFWQSKAGATEGAGLGLFIASGLVAAHGGTLRVDSAPGRGSRFWFQLPRPAEETTVERAPSPAAHARARCGTQLTEPDALPRAPPEAL